MTSTVPAGMERPQAAASPPRLGFLGLGWIGRHRLQALVASAAGEVVALADLSQDRVHDAHEVAPDAMRLRTIDELLELDLDGVVIATPSALHAEQSLRALERGMAVFCQKPLARTADENRAVVDAARRTDRLLGIDLSYRHTSALRAVREAVRAGATGAVYAVDLTFHNAYGPDMGWARDASLSGGGCVMDLGIHLVDMALWTLDFPRVTHVDSQLFAHGERLLPGIAQCEDHAFATIELDTGVVVRLACSWDARTGRDAIIEAAFTGTAAAAVMRNVDGSFFDFTAELCHGASSRLLCRPPDDWGGRALIEWSTRLGRGDGYDAAVESIIDVASTLDAVLGR